MSTVLRRDDRSTAAPRRVPGPRGLPLVGVAASFMRDPLGYFEKMVAKHGPIFELPLGRTRYVFVNNAELAEAILGRDFDSFNVSSAAEVALEPLLGQSIASTTDPLLWEQLHKLMLPMFTPRMLRNYFESTVDAIAEDLEIFERSATSGQPVLLYDAVRHGVFAALTRTMFARGMTHEEIPELLDLFTSSNKYTSARYLTNSHPMIMAIPSVRKGKRDLDRINARAFELIRERRAAPVETAEDMLDVLVGATNDDGVPLTDNQVRDNLVALWFGGQETTPTVATWAFGILASDHAIRDRVLDEVDRVLGGRRPEFADLDSLEYTSSVLDEAMRLYPPFSFVGREAMKGMQIGGYEIAKGQQLGFVGWTIHREAANWPDPEKVDPERHSAEMRKQRARCSFLSFGYGKRRCIGERVGRMEATLMLAMVSQRFLLEHADGRMPNPKVEMSIKPENGMEMIVRRR